MEKLRAIRDKISFETMDMTFGELKSYLAKRSTIHDAGVWKNKYKSNSKPLIAAEPEPKYRAVKRTRSGAKPRRK